MPTKRLIGQSDLLARRLAGVCVGAGVLLTGLAGAGCHATSERDAYYSARSLTVMPQAGNGSALVAEPLDMFEQLAADYRGGDERSAVAVVGIAEVGE